MSRGIKIEQNDLDNATKVAVFHPEKVYFPLVDPKLNQLIPLVKVGDKVKVGTVLAYRKDFPLPLISSVSGTICDNESLYYSNAKKEVIHLVMTNDKLYDAEEKMPIVSKEDAPELIIDNMLNAGIVGLGGAGFPTYFKYKIASNITTILINGVECEPFLSTDFAMMQLESEYLLKGIQIMMTAAHATKGIIAFKSYKTKVKEALLADIDKYENIEIRTVANLYPMGGEKTLIKKIFKREIERLPSEVGIIVNNVQTAIAIAKACLDGEKLTKKVLTLSGDGISNKTNVIVPIGTCVSDIIAWNGGYACQKVNLLIGGPMTSSSLPTDKIAVLPSNNAITIMINEDYNKDICLKCGRCSAHCPSYLQPVEIKDAVKNRDIERLMKLSVKKCVECGLCSYICPSKIEVSDSIKKAKMMVTIEEAKQERMKKI